MFGFDTIDTIQTKTDSDGRLYASVTGEDVFGSAVIAEYRTDKDGCGLWRWDRKRRDWVQILGTGEYSARDQAALRRKLRDMLLAC